MDRYETIKIDKSFILKNMKVAVYYVKSSDKIVYESEIKINNETYKESLSIDKQVYLDNRESDIDSKNFDKSCQEILYVKIADQMKERNKKKLNYVNNTIQTISSGRK